MTVEVQVRRKTRDLVCDAAEDALRARWPEIAAVDRAESWTFRIEPVDAPKLRRVLEDSTLVANPNVHRWKFAHEAADESPPHSRSRVRLLVRDRVDARSAAVLRSMRDRRGVDSLSGVRRAVLWTIDVDLPREEALAIAQGLAGLSGRGAGLLANSHAQDVELDVEGA